MKNSLENAEFILALYLQCSVAVVILLHARAMIFTDIELINIGYESHSTAVRGCAAVTLHL